MKRKLIAGTVLTLGILSMALPGQTLDVEEREIGLWERERHRRGPRLMAFLEDERIKTVLGLTEQQTDRLRQIMVDTQKSSVRTGADMAVRGIELREFLRVDKPDREAVLKKVQEISDLRRDMMKQHVEALLTAKTVLTPEQQKKIRTFMESRSRSAFWRERFRERRREAPESPADPGTPPLRPPRIPGAPPSE